jgi:DNA-binding CsgD family transcriptional regulator
MNMPGQILSGNTVYSGQLSDRRNSAFNNYQHLYQKVLENWVDGILVLTKAGSLIYSNFSARKLLVQLNPDASHSQLPQVLRQVLQKLANPDQLSIQPGFLTSEIWVSQSTLLRIRVQQLDLQEQEQGIMVHLEDCQQANRDRALFEVQRYQLTDREAEVWRLRREGYSYRKIADHLYVSVNTVKQHLKHIHAKQKVYFDIAG